MSDDDNKEAKEALGLLLLGAVLVGLVLLTALVFIFAPGMILMGIVKSAFLRHLDRGQMWTFSILSSLAVFGLFAALSARVGGLTKLKKLLSGEGESAGSFMVALGLYFTLSLASIILGMIL